jgi:AraC family transcriptional regulator
MEHAARALALDCNLAAAGDVVRFAQAEAGSRAGAAGALRPASPGVLIEPAGAVRRQSATWRGIAGDVLRVVGGEPLELSFRAPVHLLIVYETGARRTGETVVDGHPPARLQDFSGKLSFVPAGMAFRERQTPLRPARAVCLYLDPAAPFLDPEARFAAAALPPRLFFQNPVLWETALKLKALIEAGDGASGAYAEALGAVLAHELMRMNADAGAARPLALGGLAPWQQRVVARHIEDHLAAAIPLATLAALARLSPFHFARAFKRSFGRPPHRYHTERRIERAKALLAEPGRSVTEIALELGFSETSSFTAVFRKVMGRTPTAWRRTLL